MLKPAVKMNVKPSDKLAILVHFSYEISQETRLVPLLDLLATQISRVLTADRSSVFLYDKDKHELWSIVAQGIYDKELRFPADKGIIGYVLQTGLMVNIEDAYQDFRFNPESDKKNNYMTKTVLAMPLKDRHGNVLGVFQVLNKIGGNFDREDEDLLQMIGLLASAAIENAKLYDDLRKSHYEMVLRLARATQYRDKEDLEGHLRRMSCYTAIIAEAIGMPSEEVELNIAFNVAYAHHEKYDGTGYPRGLRGDEIPLEARIVALADVFDALVSKRSYKEAWSIDETVEYIKERSGKQFDPSVVDAFIKSLPVIRATIANNNF